MENLEQKKLQAIAETYRSQCIFFLDSIANQMAHVTELREKLADAEVKPDDRDARIAELEETVRGKDEQITEQSNRIVELRAKIEALG